MCCGSCSPAALCFRRCCCCSRSWYSTTASTAPMPMSTSPAILSPPAASCLRRARFRIQIESGSDSESDPPRPGPTQKTGNGRATHSYTVRFAGISKAATTCCLATCFAPPVWSPVRCISSSGAAAAVRPSAAAAAAASAAAAAAAAATAPAAIALRNHHGQLDVVDRLRLVDGEAGGGA